MVTSNGYANGIVQQTSETASGTGNLNLESLAQFRDLSDEYSTGGTDVFKYFLRDKGSGAMEYGTGHLVDATTLARDTVLWSTNSNSLVDFGEGVKLLTQEPAINSSGEFVFGASEFQGDISDDQANTIWDYSAQEIPDAAMGSIDNSTLTNSSITVTAGDGLKNGGSVSLGGSTTVDIEPADFAGNALEDDGSDNLAVASGGINTSEIATDAVTTNEANFTDQQLSTTDSPTFAGVTINNGGTVGAGINSQWTFDSTNGDISTSGKVGIGTTNPSSQLQVNGSGVVDISSYDEGAATDEKWMVIRNSAGVTSFIPHSDTGGSLGTALAIRHSTGNVGIGTTSPTSRLDLSGGDISSAGSIQFSDADGDGSTWNITEDANGDLVATHPTGGTTVLASE